MPLTSFNVLFEQAAARKGGADAFEATMPELKSAKDLGGIPDDRWLSTFSKGIFSTGLNWKVVSNKWTGIEEALWEFRISRCAMMSDEDLDALLKDQRVIRHAAKLLSVRDNAIFFADLAKEHGSAAKFFAEWPEDDFIGLIALMKKRGSRVGGNTGMYALRFMGKDGFVLGGDVVKALISEGVVTKAPTSQRDLRATQDAFNAWRSESGRPLAHISRTLACTVE
ncbi:MAG: DNA-3-methyladenine glycosylase I [Pseudomonadota bacterium]